MTARGHIPDRFWAKVDRAGPTDCWLWKGAQNGYGYGSFRVSHPRRRLVYVHRFVFEAEVAEIPPGMTIDHLCHTRLCVNPAHMALATYAENSQRRRNARLTLEQARTIRAMRGTQQEIADRYGVSRSMVQTIKAGKKWA